MKGINVSAFFYPDIEKVSYIPKNSILRVPPKFPLNSSHNYDYILSDNILEYELVETINYNNFNFYIYKFPLRQNFKINKIYQIKSNKNYKKNFFEFKNFLFLYENKKKIDKIDAQFFCDFKYFIIIIFKIFD